MSLIQKTAFLAIIAGIVTLPGLWFDSRTIMGVNAWLKPIKFDFSIAIFLLTMSWVIAYIDDPVRGWLGAAFSGVMIVEAVAINIQAYRGTTSHYNLNTPLDAAIFSAMALAIFLLPFLILGSIFALNLSKIPCSSVFRLSMQLGLFLLLLGFAVGFKMVANRGHTVGMPDGGPGLPIINWSTRAGDLRIAHFVGLHGIQVLMGVGYLLGEGKRLTASLPRTTAYTAVTLVFTIFCGMFGWTYFNAIRSKALF